MSGDEGSRPTWHDYDRHFEDVRVLHCLVSEGCGGQRVVYVFHCNEKAMEPSVHGHAEPRRHRAAGPQSRRATEPQSCRAGEPHSCMAAGPQSCRAAGPQSCRAGEPGSRRAGDQTMSRSHEAPYTLLGCTLRLTRLHFLTNVDEKIYASLMNIVMIYLTALRHLFQQRSDISDNSAAEMSQCSATFAIIVRGAELAKVPNSCT